jgi:hypothetical protein
MNSKLVIATLILGAGCMQGPVADETDVGLSLESRHTSVFNKIRYQIPKGWLVVDGESDWLAPNEDKQFWAPGFDVDNDAYYVVSVVFPYLTMEDMSQKRARSFGDIVSATLHSLEVAAGANLLEPLEFSTVNGNDSASLSMSVSESHVHYQVFVHLVDDTMATVAGNGPRDQLKSIRALVTAIAATVEPGIKK